MKGFKDTTRVQYFKGGAVEKACGGVVKKATGGKVKIVAPGDAEPYGNKGTYKYREEGPGFRMDETEFRVMRDISNRDRADSEKAKRPNASKLDKMAGREAVSRMNRMGWAEEGFNEDTGIGLIQKSRQKGAAAARSDAVRPNYVKKAEGGRVTDPVKNKTGGKNDPEYGDYAISKVEKSAKPVARAPATRGKSVPVAKSAPLIKAR